MRLINYNKIKYFYLRLFKVKLFYNENIKKKLYLKLKKKK